MSVDIQSDPSPKLGRPQPLFRTEQYRRNVNLRNYDIHPDGKRFLFIRPERRSDQLHVVLNWFSELERLEYREGEFGQRRRSVEVELRELAKGHEKRWRFGETYAP
jgi:hypothetical protein